MSTATRDRRLGELADACAEVADRYRRVRA
jgi:hypothetical protein